MTTVTATSVSSSSTGGGLYLASSGISVTATSVTFTDITATDYGGVFYFKNTGSLTI